MPQLVNQSSEALVRKDTVRLTRLFAWQKRLWARDSLQTLHSPVLNKNRDALACMLVGMVALKACIRTAIRKIYIEKHFESFRRRRFSAWRRGRFAGNRMKRTSEEFQVAECLAKRCVLNLLPHRLTQRLTADCKSSA